MSLYLGNNLISGVATPVEPTRNIGQIIESIVPLTDAGLHLLDGALISGSGIYADFVTYIAGLVSTYPDLFETEANWQTSVTTYGVCGKFVYDSTNNTVRLPKITGVVEGTTDLTALGDLVEAGLPNITGSFAANMLTDGGEYATGAFGVGGSASKNTPNCANDGSQTGFNFNASNSSSIYGNSDTVQPQTIKVLYYIVIATSTKTDIQVDIDEIATDLNGKADRDLTNLTNGLTNTICSTTATTTSSASFARPAVVVENYVNGTSWYRVWSDGWIEQGGTASKDTTVDFLKPFSNSDYSLVISYYRPNNETAEYVVSAKNYNNFRTKSNVGNASPCYWMASGY